MPDDKKPVPQINNQVRQSWNDYVKWLRAKGIAGSPTLDKGGLGKQYLAQYIKENPNTALTMDIVAPIQADLMKYKDYAVNQIRLGKAVYANGVNADTFMEDLSKEDNYPGQFTTKHIYPNEYLRTVDLQNNTDSTINKGFAIAQN